MSKVQRVKRPDIPSSASAFWGNAHKARQGLFAFLNTVNGRHANMIISIVILEVNSENERTYLSLVAASNNNQDLEAKLSKPASSNESIFTGLIHHASEMATLDLQRIKFADYSLYPFAFNQFKLQ